METITTYTLIYEKDGYILEDNFQTEAQARTFFSQAGITAIKLYRQRILGDLVDIPII